MLEILRAFVGIPRGVPTHHNERHSSQLSANVFILSSLRSTQFYMLCSVSLHLNHYFDRHVCPSIRPSVRSSFLPSVTNLFFRLNRLGIIP